MSSYPPGPSNASFAGENYELRSPQQHESALPGPSRFRQAKQRTLTLHPSVSTSALLFSAPSGSQPSPKRRHSSMSQSPEITARRHHRSHFLQDEGAASEEVHVPDIGHMLGIDDTNADHFAVASRMTSPWKRRLYLLMEEPASGREAFTVHVLVTGAILFSAVLTTLSTLPSFHTDPTSTKTLFGLDTTLVVLFTVEYLARTAAHSDSFAQYYRWATSFFALLDLIAILPYYIEVARNDDTSILFRFSILRTFRLLRVFRAFKYQNQMLLTIEVMYVAVQRSKDAMVALSFFILLVLVFFSTLIYFAERGTWDANLGAFVDVDGDPSSFDSIPKTAWFALVTMSTVGYGEVVPRSSLGKLLTVPLLMFGLLLIALPSFVLGRNFAIVFDAMTKQAPPFIPSMEATPRSSTDQSVQIPENVPTTIPPSDSNAPLLPVSNGDPSLLGVDRPPRRGPSPNPLGAVMGSSASGSSLRPGGPRMWDGGMDGLLERKAERDLTNVKLAKNQIVLLEQIEHLRQTIGQQGQMLTRLLEAFGAGTVELNRHPPELQ